MATLQSSLMRLGLSKTQTETLFDSFQNARTVLSTIGVNLEHHHRLRDLLAPQIDLMCTFSEQGEGAYLDSVREFSILSFILSQLIFRIHYLEGTQHRLTKDVLLVQSILVRYPADCKKFLQTLHSYRTSGEEFVQFLFNDEFQMSEFPIYPEIFRHVDCVVADEPVSFVDWQFPVDIPETVTLIHPPKFNAETFACGYVNGEPTVGPVAPRPQYFWAYRSFYSYANQVAKKKFAMRQRAFVYTPERYKLHPMIVGQPAVLQQVLFAGVNAMMRDDAKSVLYFKTSALIANYLNSLQQIGPPSLMEFAFLKAMRGKLYA